MAIENIEPSEESLKEQQTKQKMFSRNIDHKDVEAYYGASIQHITNYFSALDEEKLEHYRLEYEKDARDGGQSEQLQYVGLRHEGFSHEEICEIFNESSSGELERFLLEKIRNEQEGIETLLRSGQEQIRTADNALGGLFVGEGHDTLHLAPTVFFGKYQGLVLGANQGSDEIRVIGSCYFPIEDIVYVRLGELDGQRLSEKTVHTYVHEHIHGRSFREVENDDTHRLFDANSGVARSGFMSIGKDVSAGYSLNEATTEFFTRKLMKTVESNFQSGTYEEEVRSLHILLEFLVHEEGVSIEDKERELLSLYTSKDGVSDFSRHLEEKVGRFSSQICQKLFMYPEMLRAFLERGGAVRRGEHAETLQISPYGFDDRDFLNNNIEGIRTAYPFLMIGVEEYDKEKDTFIWKEWMPTY